MKADGERITDIAFSGLGTVAAKTELQRTRAKSLNSGCT
jgi:hypothetical protein